MGELWLLSNVDRKGSIPSGRAEMVFTIVEVLRKEWIRAGEDLLPQCPPLWLN